MKVYNYEQTVSIEDRSEQLGVSRLTLMENAGRVAAEHINGLFKVNDRKAVILCGSGNNGGDGYAAALTLYQLGADVTLIMAFGPPKTDNAQQMFRRSQTASIKTIDFRSEPERCIDIVYSADIIIDALYGTGFYGNIPDSLISLTEAVNHCSCVIVSLDIPSGVACDSCEVSYGAIRADCTIAFISYKPCHIFYPSAEYCGRIIVADIGVPEHSVNSFIDVIDEQDVWSNFKRRPKVCHKGDFGKALLVCGSYSMSGAAKIALKSAVRCGVGLAVSAVVESIYPIVASAADEPTYVICEQNSLGTFSANSINNIISAAENSSAVLIGCGMGCNTDTVSLTSRLLQKTDRPIVIDADGINCLKDNIDILAGSNAIITPHYGEMSRLTGLPIDAIAADPVKIARSTSVELGITVVLKGARTVISDKNGNVYINTTGNPGMASAGCGDMLAGMMVSFLAQGFEPIQAARSAVFIHGLCADRVSEVYSERSMTVTDMINELPAVFKLHE